MSAFFAFLHHLAAFALVAALTAEFVLLKDELNVRTARRLQLADAALGASAGVVLVVGFLRVVYFEKGAAYYFHSAPFLAKITLFLIVGLLSIYPTLEFLAWGKALKDGRAPAVSEHKLGVIRKIVHWELAGVVLLLLNAALMARGVGYFG